MVLYKEMIYTSLYLYRPKEIVCAENCSAHWKWMFYVIIAYLPVLKRRMSRSHLSIN